MGFLKHLVYFEELAETDEGTERWNAVTAGLVVLRFLDNWMDFGESSIANNKKGIKNIRAAVAALDQTRPLSKILSVLFEAVFKARHPDISDILPHLMAYGRALHYEADWRLSRDVFENTLELAGGNADVSLQIDAHMHIAYCARMLGQFDDAAEAYAEAGQIAASTDDVERLLRVRIADARLSMDRGQHREGALLLDDCIKQAAASEELRELHGIALHDRSNVAVVLKDFEEAVVLGWDAYGRLSSNLIVRDRVLADLATILADMGLFSASRQALLRVSRTAQEEYLRWVAMINLMEVASMQYDQQEFESCRQSLSAVSLPATLEANYLLHVGRAYQRFGDNTPAREFLQRALALASEHKYGALGAEAQKGLDEIDAASPFVAPAFPEPSAAALQVAAAVMEMDTSTPSSV